MAPASFPFPLYSAWFKDFSRKTPGVTLDFQAKGSGAGIQDLINKTVDFAASDAAMTPEQIAQVPGEVVLLPMTAGEIVLAYNLPGLDKPLRLSRDVYPDIFLGKITNWSDPRIAAANPGVKLPNLPITVVRRSDASGTTFVFTKHLAAISPAFREAVGFGTTVPWPNSDKIVAAPKNDGVTATIKQTPGAIGYIEYGYAKLTRAATALLQNKAGQFVAPGDASGAAALASAELPEDLIAWIDDPKSPRVLSDRQLHLAAGVQETRSGQGGSAAQARRLWTDRRSEACRSHGLHPAAAECDREGVRRLLQDSIRLPHHRRFISVASVAQEVVE